jgi:hypothetical protein
MEKSVVNAGRIIQLGHYASQKKKHILLFQSYEIIIFPHDITGWWIENPSEKYESQLGVLFPIYGKKQVPNHQPQITSIFL